MQQVIYRQLNKDYAYWTEKRRVGQMRGGQVAGLFTLLEDGTARQHILIDAGLGTLEAIADFCPDEFWDDPLDIFVTHGHIDHHAELMIVSEIYCTRRGVDIYDLRPPLDVYCTDGTQAHLDMTHRWGYTGGKTLNHIPISDGVPVERGPFRITPIEVDHFDGAAIFVVEFELSQPHKVLIGWDMTTLPLAEPQVALMRNPSLALIEATTWQALSVGHTSIEELVDSGFLDKLELGYEPQNQRYGAYFVHYSGLEDEWGMLPDSELKARFDAHYPALADVVLMAERGQEWYFH